MPAGQLYINGADAFTAWGVSLDSTAMSALMTPAPLKAMIENRSRLEHGVRRIRTGRYIDDRTVKLGLNMWANTDATFKTNYDAFLTNILVTNTGKVELTTSLIPNMIFHFDYISCESFGVHRSQLAKLVLTLVESNPSDRSVSNE